MYSVNVPSILLDSGSDRDASLAHPDQLAWASVLGAAEYPFGGDFSTGDLGILQPALTRLSTECILPRPPPSGVWRFGYRQLEECVTQCWFRRFESSD
jgi:hypothetical protein